MKDRQPLKPNRVLIKPEDGSAPYYATVTRADDPIERGDPLCKNTFFKDATAALYGMDTTAVPDDAFKNIAKRFELLKTGKAWVSVKVQDASGSPVTQVIVAGITDGNGGSVYTNENGVAEGYSANGTITLSISGYADVEDITKSITVGSGEIVYTEIVATRRNFLKLTSSTNVQFSGEVDTVDVTVVGGGGGGASGSNLYNTPCGGGGGYCVVQAGIAVSTKTSYSAVVGAGGSAGENSSAGGNGGSSSFLEISASGGGGGSKSGGGAGNGNGGAAASNGIDGSVYGYSSYTETVLYGGGGAGGTDGDGYGVTNQAKGGKSFGGNGGHIYRNTSVLEYMPASGSQGTDGGGGGGGAGCHQQHGTHANHTSGGRGGSGCVAMRIHFKGAA